MSFFLFLPTIIINDVSGGDPMIEMTTMTIEESGVRMMMVNIEFEVNCFEEVRK